MKSVAKTLSFVLAVIMIAVLVGGCTQPTPAPAPTAAPAPAAPAAAAPAAAAPAAPAAQAGLPGVKVDPNERYVMVTFLSGIEFWKPAYRGMQDAAKIYGVQTVYQGTEKYDAQAEATVLEQVIASKPAGIIVTAQSPDALKPYIDKAIDSGITTIMFDSDSPQSKRPIVVEVDNHAAGMLAAKRMCELTGGKGSVGIITTPGQFNLDTRSKGMQDGVKACGMKVIGECKGLGDYALAAGCASGFLQGNADMTGIFSTGSDGAPASVQAFREAGKLGQIKIVGFDIDAATIEGIEKGEIDATVVQGAYNMGYWAMMMTFSLHHNLVNPFPGWKEKGLPPLPNSIDAGAYLADKKNIDAFK